MVSSSSSGASSSPPPPPVGANLPAFIYLVMLAVWANRRRVAEIHLRNAIRRENAQRFRRRAAAAEGNRRRPYRPHLPGNINCTCRRCLALHRPLVEGMPAAGSLAARRGLSCKLTIPIPAWGEVYGPVEETEEELRRESITRNFLDGEGFGCKSCGGRWDDGSGDEDGEGDGNSGGVEGNLDLEFRL